MIRSPEPLLHDNVRVEPEVLDLRLDLVDLLADPLPDGLVEVPELLLGVLRHLDLVHRAA